MTLWHFIGFFLVMALALHFIVPALGSYGQLLTW
jgi:F0F1-type ATP synthase membrane subunit b/b'